MSAANELAKLGPLSKLNPDAMTAFGAFDAAAMGDGAVSKKTKELIAVAVALTTMSILPDHSYRNGKESRCNR